MKYIAPIAVVAILLLQFTGGIPKSSVGGPMTIALVFLTASLALGVHDAWSNKRGVLGWIGSIVTVLVGAYLTAEIFSLIFELILPFINLQGSILEIGVFLPYVSLAGMMLINLLGSWTALRLVNRWR